MAIFFARVPSLQLLLPLIAAWRVTGAAIHCSRSIFLRARPYAKTAYGRKRISYMDLRKGHGPPKTLTPTSESIYRQCHWICIVRPFFALMWPESASLSAREPIAGCLRAIARLLHLGRAKWLSEFELAKGATRADNCLPSFRSEFCSGVVLGGDLARR